MNNEVYLGNVTVEMYSDIINWCRRAFGAYTYGKKWTMDDEYRMMLSDDFYTLFLLRWA